MLVKMYHDANDDGNYDNDGDDDADAEADDCAADADDDGDNDCDNDDAGGRNNDYKDKCDDGSAVDDDANGDP